MYVPVLLIPNQNHKQTNNRLDLGILSYKHKIQSIIHLSNSTKILTKLRELWIQLGFAVFMKFWYLENIICENSYYDAAPVKLSNM